MLAKKPYLVGDKVTIADLGFIPWNVIIPRLMKDAPKDIDLTKYTHYQKWHESLMARPAVKKVYEIKANV